MSTHRSKLTTRQQQPPYRPGSVLERSPVRLKSPTPSYHGKRIKGRVVLASKLLPQKPFHPTSLFDTPETAVRKSGFNPPVVKRHRRTTSDYSAHVTRHRPNHSGVPLTQLPTLSNINRSVNASPDSGPSPPDRRIAANSRSRGKKPL